MFVDKQAEYSDSQLITVTAISTNVQDTLPGISFTNVIQNLGGFAGSCWLVVQVDTTFTAAGAATLVISLESDSTANLATAPTVHFTSAAIAKTALLAGVTLLIFPVPFGNFQRYLGLRYTVGTGPMTTGAISAFLTTTPQTWKPYPVAQASNL